MKKLRSQILKIYVIGLVFCGLSLAAAQPVEAKKSSDDFTNWLQSVAKKTHAHKLEDQLASLKKSGVQLSQLIEEASRIVSQNNDDFNLPLNASSASEKIHQILLVEWNQFQTGNAMTGIPPAPSVKPVIHFQAPKFFTGGAVLLSGRFDAYIVPFVTNAEAENFYTSLYTVTPMSGGVAIGAP